MITLLSEALCVTTYLSLYLHRIVKFYFLCFLTFIFSFDWCFGRKKHALAYLFIETLKFSKKFADVSIFEKIQNFDNVSGFCSPEFDLFMKDSAIFRLICNERHSGIPKSQIKTLATFNNEIKLDLQTYAKSSTSLSKKR